MLSSEFEFRVKDQAIKCKYRHSLPLVYTASVDEVAKRWEGRATIPLSYFPPNVTLFNAYAIHGVGESRRKVEIADARMMNRFRYEALYESSGPAPDFHRLSKFQPIDFQYLLPDNKGSNLSATWKTAIAEAKVSKYDFLIFSCYHPFLDCIRRILSALQQNEVMGNPSLTSKRFLRPERFSQG